MNSPAASLLSDLADVLGHVGLRWYVFGAQAVLLYGRPRLTEDVDVTVFLGETPHNRLIAELVAVGFTLDPVADEQFIRTTRVLPFVHHSSGMAADIVLGGPGLEELFVERAEPRSLGGVTVPVICVEHLLVTKVLAGRDKDRADAREILAGNSEKIDLDEVRALLDQLEVGLGRSDLVPLLETLLPSASD